MVSLRRTAKSWWAALDRVPHVRRTLAVALVLALLAFVFSMSLSFLPWAYLDKQVRFDAAANMPRTIDESSPVYKIAQSLASMSWPLVQCDGTPSVHIGECYGYRIVLRRAWKDRESHDVSVTKRVHADIVLFPSDQLLSRNLKKRIKWEKLEYRPRDNMSRVPVYMGNGHGYHWYGRLTVPQQEKIRAEFDLAGGDDQLALLVELLGQVKDKERRHRVLDLLPNVGEDAIPVLEKEIEDNRYDCRSYAMFALGRIPGKRSTDILLALYDNPEARRWVPYAVGLGPFRPEAKHIYLDMLKHKPKPIYFWKVLDMVVESQWKEAIPLLEVVCQEPHTIGLYMRSRRGIRAFQNDLVDAAWQAKLGEAGSAICNVHHWRGEEHRSDPEDIERAQETILACPDSDAAIMMALGLAVAMWKGNCQEPNRIGVTLLQQLPRDEVLPVLEHLASSVREQQSRTQAIEILESVKESTTESISQVDG